MDHVKKFVNALKTQRFWVICGLITILPLIAWFWKTSDMRATTAERKDQISAKFKDAESLRGKQDPPNDKSHEEMQKLIEDLKQRVVDAWQEQYNKQLSLLVWPSELGEGFLREVRDLKPIEKVKFPTDEKDEFRPLYREVYRNYIKKELPKLAEIIGARWTARENIAMGGSGDMGMSGMEMSGMAMSGMPGGMESGYGASGPGYGGVSGPMGQSFVDDSKVQWSSQDQSALLARYNWQGAPRKLDVLYAQEDLWVMTAVMNVIAETNAEATARYNAVVKDIQYISLGRSGGGGRVSAVRSSSATGGGMGGGSMYGMMGMDPSMGMDTAMDSGMGMDGGMMPGMSSLLGMEGEGDAFAANTIVTPDPANNRYVDFNYQPIPAETLRAAIESDAQNPEEAYLLVAKRIPIRLGVTVDQRKLNRLIAACGNSNLMVEVRQVRFNKQSGRGAGMGGGGYGGMMGGGYGDMSGMDYSDMSGDSGGFGGMPGGMPGGMMSGMPGGMGDSGMGGYSHNTMVTTDTSRHDKPVELFGVVYIYNPVDVRKLKLEEGAASAPPADTGG